jgi:RNA polymerase sigma-70 factor, ECF subfamily
MEHSGRSPAKGSVLDRADVADRADLADRADAADRADVADRADMDDVADRDIQWFEGLFTRFHGPVGAYASRRAPDEADDIVADVFAVAWRKREDVPDNALPWLYAVAAREMLHTFRAHDRRDRLSARLQATTLLVYPDPAEQIAGRLDAQEPVTRALGLLSEPDAEVLRLWAWEHLEPAEIATVLGISSVASRVRLHRARRRLESLLLTTTNIHRTLSISTQEGQS